MPTVNQTRATAEGSIAGRDINNTVNLNSPHSATVIERLLASLQSEMDDEKHVQITIDKLQRFYTKRSADGIDGLAAKLEKSGRSAFYFDAIELKEMFAKLLERWSLYESAQQIFVYLLARAERQFNDIIRPQLNSCDIACINGLVDRLIVEPTVNECGATVFSIDHNVATGMIYWLAEQCFVRWHV